MALLTPQQSSTKKINDAIKNITTSYAKANALVHEVGVMILGHSNEYGDCTGAARLVAAMPASTRRAMVIDWFTKYSPIRIFKDGDTFNAAYRKPEDKLYSPFKMDEAKANPWYDAKKKDKELEEALNLGSAKQAFYAILSKMEKNLKSANENDKAPIEAMMARIRLAMVTDANGQPIAKAA